MSSPVTTMFTGKCPRCGQSSVFSGPLEVKERCDTCGVVFMRDPGAWTGATAVGYMVGCGFAVVLLLGLWATGNLTRGIEWVVVPSVLGAQLVTFRFVKGFWVGLLDEWGYVYADPPVTDAAPSPTTPTTPATAQGR